MRLPKGLIIAAPMSNSGKTFLTLGLLRALRQKGVSLATGKIGPDYIDPGFHSLASGAECFNFDSWAMRPESLFHLITTAQDSKGAPPEIMIVEGVMGLFDGAHGVSSPFFPDLAAGSTAELAALTGWPIIFCVSCQGMALSLAALVQGFRDFSPHIRVENVLLNRVGSLHHGRMLKESLAQKGLSCLGMLPRQESLTLPDRHLGLVPAKERQDIQAFLDQSAAHIAAHLDLETIQACARTGRIADPAAQAPAPQTPALMIPPLGQRIAIARDDAFCFTYPHFLHIWRQQGCEFTFFSPLANEAPCPQADAVFLPGGYPELKAAPLSSADHFLKGLRDHSLQGHKIYGECGGYMMLGTSLEDAEGQFHKMAGLLPLETSFRHKKRHLGYRRVKDLPGFFGVPGDHFRGHEFHYTTIIAEGPTPPLFEVQNAAGLSQGSCGQQVGSVAGSFIHLIDKAF